MSSTQNKQARLQRLAEALEHYEAHGSDLFDHGLEEEKAKVRKRALLLLDHRLRSRKELTDRLIALEFEPDIVNKVIEDFIRVGLVNDEAFAEQWVRERFAMRGKSRSILAMELREKGIAESISAQALAQIDDDDEAAKAEKLAAKKARSIKEVPGDKKMYNADLRRVVGVLARRGFPAGLSMRIARQELDRRINELS
ncbi:regulatory protein RecX [Corynebacterium kutscheri]|uniref:regulatory protein RecX n=1 Tax=Corynebacterium kutscheri TaxID=35755 RepID=UPI0037C150EB